MVTMKAIIWIRTSTKEQSIEDQERDLRSWALSKGYNELTVIGKQGASAIKMDEQYKRETSILIDTLSKSDIKCVFVWEVSRLARNELAFYTMKSFIVKNKIQLYCKTPELKLLNDDGTINQGAEIALNLLVTLAKQEMQIKNARFSRKREAMNKLGKLTTGKPAFGYYKTGKGFGAEIHIDEEKADLIRRIFNRYSKDDISLRRIAMSLMTNEQWPTESRKNIVNSYSLVHTIITNPLYSGRKAKRGFTVYPPIISAELQDYCISKCKAAIRKSKTNTKNVYYCKSLIRHAKSNLVMISQRSQAVYYSHTESAGADPDRIAISINVADSLAWAVAKHYKAIMTDLGNDNKEREYKATVAENKSEMNKLSTQIEKVQQKRKKAQKKLLKGLVDDDVYEDINKEWNKEEKEYASRIAELKSQNEQLTYLIENKDDSDNSMMLTRQSLDSITDDRARKKIIDEIIKAIYVDRTGRGEYKLWYELKVPIQPLPFYYIYKTKGSRKYLFRVYPDGKTDDISDIIEMRIKKYNY